jgi:putative Mg2+ transporter-C (MgtC) family protein
LSEIYKILSPWIVHVVLAAVVGGSIGWQRQITGSPAGLRTHMLVCIGSTLLVTLDMLNPAWQGKIAAAVVTGIGFLGAGTIIHSDKGDSVRGLTTAASVWVTAGIGIAIGDGGIATWIGAFVAVLVLTTLSVVYNIEDYALRYRRDRILSLSISRQSGEDNDAVTSKVMKLLTDAGAAVEGIVKDSYSLGSPVTILRIRVRLPRGFDASEILRVCGNNADVVQVSWEL